MILAHQCGKIDGKNKDCGRSHHKAAETFNPLLGISRNGDPRRQRPNRRRLPHKTGLGPSSSFGEILFEAIQGLAAGASFILVTTTHNHHYQKM
jgi:hypothetical protein